MATTGLAAPRSSKRKLGDDPDPSLADPEFAKRLRTLIEKQLDQTCKGWKNSAPPVRIPGNQFDTKDDQRASIQAIGAKSGCHTCGFYLNADNNQPWVADHNPPTNLSDAAKKALWPKGMPSLVLMPQCDRCAREQATLVKALNGMSATQVAKYKFKGNEKKLILGGVPLRTPKYCLSTAGTKATDSEGKAIQALGILNKCHSCGSDKPCTTYHADHIFPAEFATPYMQRVFKALGISHPGMAAQNELRPQCPRCSGEQGGK